MYERNAAHWRTAGGIAMALLTLTLILAGCGATTGAGGSPAPTATDASATTPQADKPAVTIAANGDYGYGYGAGTFSFTPTSITVKVGTTVVWTNTSGTAHMVTSDAGVPEAFKSGMIDGSNGTFRFTLTKPGSYTYHCAIHPYMQGTIVVTS